MDNRAGATNVNKLEKKVESNRENPSGLNVSSVQDAISILNACLKTRNVSFGITKDILLGNVERSSDKVEEGNLQSRTIFWIKTKAMMKRRYSLST